MKSFTPDPAFQKQIDLDVSAERMSEISSASPMRAARLWLESTGSAPQEIEDVLAVLRWCEHKRFVRRTSAAIMRASIIRSEIRLHVVDWKAATGTH
jgi:hypothetical protein